MDKHPMALTTLTEEDEAFRAAVNKFAESKLKPKIKDQERNMVFDKAVINACFEMGLMGIMIPEEYGGLGGTFFQAVLAKMPGTKRS